MWEALITAYLTHIILQNKVLATFHLLYHFYSTHTVFTCLLKLWTPYFYFCVIFMLRCCFNLVIKTGQSQLCLTEVFFNINYNLLISIKIIFLTFVFTSRGSINIVFVINLPSFETVSKQKRKWIPADKIHWKAYLIHLKDD